MTPRGETVMPRDVADDNLLIKRLEAMLDLHRFPSYAQVNRIQLYYKLKDNNNLVEYVIMRFLIEPSSRLHFDIFEHIVLTIHNTVFNYNQFELFTECVSFRSSGNSTIHVPSHDDRVDSIDSIKTEMRSIDTCINKDTIDLKNTHICPYFNVSLDDIPMAVVNGILVTKEPLAAQLRLPRWEFEQYGNYISICSMQFNYVYELMASYSPIEYKKNDYVHPKQILAFICMCLSIACLFFTLLVYSAIKELQTQPGINNVTLCMCLMCAQCLYQFGVGQRSLTSLSCTLIGAFCHFFWLTVMFSMNTCCIQMFLIFKRHTFLSSRFNPKHTLRYLAYTTTMSLMLVCVNVSVSLATTNGEDTGYGGIICYISTSLMHLLTFVIPSAITTAVNISLFSYTVFSISKTSATLATLNRQERNYFAVYARLSTLTGLTWIFGYLFILLKYEFLEYLFIIFNASQGVFIMIAFVLNKRVVQLIFRKKARTVMTDRLSSEKKEERRVNNSVSVIDPNTIDDDDDPKYQSSSNIGFSLHPDNTLSQSITSLNKVCQILGHDPVTD